MIAMFSRWTRPESWTPPQTPPFRQDSAAAGRWDAATGGESAVAPALAWRMRLLGPVFASCWRSSPVEPAPPLHVVGHVGERHRGTRPRQADGADHQAHHPLLMREGMLDMRAHLGLGRVRPRTVPGHRPALRLAAIDTADAADTGMAGG